MSSPMQALYRVFVLPTLQQTSTRPLAQRLQRTSRQGHHLLPTSSPSSHSKRNPFSTSSSLLATRPPEKRTQFWDEEIPAARVQVVSPETKSLEPPTFLTSVLSSLDRKTHRLVCVSPPPAELRVKWREEEWIPTCRIVSKKEQYEQEKAKRSQKVQAKKNSADNVKTIELNWAIDGNDLGHRMKRVREFLTEGRRVEVVLAKRKGGRKATLEECEAVVDKIEEAVEDVPGAKELKKMEGKLGAVATLFFEGPKKAAQKDEKKAAAS